MIKSSHKTGSIATTELSKLANFLGKMSSGNSSEFSSFICSMLLLKCYCSVLLNKSIILCSQLIIIQDSSFCKTILNCIVDNILSRQRKVHLMPSVAARQNLEVFDVLWRPCFVDYEQWQFFGLDI